MNYSSFFFFLVFLHTQFVHSQTQNLQVTPSNELQFEFKFQKLIYDNNEEDLLSGSYDLNASIPVSNKLNIIANIPYRNYSVELNFGFGEFKIDRSGIGNIFLGIQTKPAELSNGNSFLTAGIFLPTADDEAADFLTDYYHIQRFIPDLLSIYFNYAYHKTNTEGFIFSVEAGPDILISTGSRNSDTEMFIHFGGSAGVKIKKIIFNVEFTGIAIVTQDTDNFSDRFVNQFGLGFHWNDELISPKVFYRVHLRDEFSNMIDGIFGIGVAVSID